MAKRMDAMTRERFMRRLALFACTIELLPRMLFSG